jgi:hypothetical protein
MIKFIIALLLITSSFSFAQDTQKTQPPVPPVANVSPAFKPDTPAIIKQRLKQYQAEQKQSLKLAKIQTQMALAQAALTATQAKNARTMAIMQAKQK